MVYGLITLAGVSLTIIATEVNDISEIRGDVLRKASFLKMSASNVVEKLTILSSKTNGACLEITALNVCGLGTNGVFTYSLLNLTDVSKVECRDSSTNGMDFFYYNTGALCSYKEYQRGEMFGVYMCFLTNTQVEVFLTTSNNFHVGKAYYFNDAGSVTNVVNADVPVSLLYTIPPYEGVVD